MKKTISILLIISMFILMLSACGEKKDDVTESATKNGSEDSSKASEDTNDEDTKKGETTVNKSNVTLTYMASQDHVKDAEYDLIEAFTTETGIKVDVQIVPADQMDTLLTTKLNSGEAPDIFMGQSGALDLVSKYNVEVNCVDLSNEEWVDREWELARSTATYKDKLYGMTVWDMSGSFSVVYNKTIFADLGLEIPKTYSEFITACETIQAAGITPIFEPVSDGWHHVLWVPQIGGRMEELEPGFYSAINNNELKFENSTNYKTAVAQLKELADKNFFGENFMSDSFGETEKVMSEGTYAMTLYNLALPAQIAAAYPDQDIDNFGFFPIPLLDNDILPADGGAPTKFIYSESKNINEAKMLFNYLAKPESLQYMIDNVAEMSSVCWDGVQGMFTKEQQIFFDNYPKKAVVLQNATSYYNPQWMDIGKDFEGMFYEAMTVEEVAKQVDLRRADAAKANKDPNWE